MPYRRDDMVRRVLSGLLVLIVLMLPVGRAGALTLPVFAAASHTALAGHGDEHAGLTISPVCNSSGSPCDGCEHPDGYACCLTCGFVVGDLPSTQNASRPLEATSLSFLMLSTAPPDGLSSAPDLPPPRHIV
jgi:hypothetical protein